MHIIIVFKTDNTVTLWDHNMHPNCMRNKQPLVMTEICCFLRIMR